jgi:hypothetical protein
MTSTDPAAIRKFSGGIRIPDPRHIVKVLCSWKKELREGAPKLGVFGLEWRLLLPILQYLG